MAIDMSARIQLMNLYNNPNVTSLSIKTAIYTSASDGVTNIVHGLSYVPLHDEIQVYDLYSGGLLTLGVNYTENANNISIDLLGWSLSKTSKIKFVLYKSIK